MRRWMWILVLWAGCWGPAQAQWERFQGGHASAGWTVEFAVVDLDPGDGVAADMRSLVWSWESDAFLGGGMRIGGTEFVAPDFRITDGRAMESIKSPQWLAVNDVYLESLEFELSPSTRLIVTGTLTAQADSPPTEVLPLGIQGLDPRSFAALTTHMFASARVELGAASSAELAVGPQGQASRSFELSLETGPGGYTTHGVMAVARAHGTGEWQLVMIPAVPEPSTLALAGLGLLAIAARALARRRGRSPA